MHSDEDWNMAIDYKNYPDFPEPVLVVDGVKGLSAEPLSKKALATIQRRDEKLRPRRIAAARTDPRQLSIFGQSHTQELTNGLHLHPLAKKPRTSR